MTSQAVTPSRKVAAITGFFVAVGPPLGALILCLGMAIVGTFDAIIRFNPYDVITTPVKAFMMWVFMVPPSYVFGVAPACLAGLAVGVLQVYRQSNGATVILTGAVVGIGYEIAIRKFIQNTTFPSAPPSYLLAMPMTCIAATFLCWRSTRNWYVYDSQTDDGRI